MAELLGAIGSLLSGAAAFLWPVIVFAAVLVLRPNLPALVAGLKSLRMGPFTAEWWQREEERAATAIVRAIAPADTSTDLIALANTSPRQAVHAAFDPLVGDLRAIAEQAGIEAVNDPVALAQMLVEKGAIDSGAPELIDTLRDMVSLATFDPGRLSSAEAISFVMLAQIARNVLRRSKTLPSG